MVQVNKTSPLFTSLDGVLEPESIELSNRLKGHDAGVNLLEQSLQDVPSVVPWASITNSTNEIKAEFSKLMQFHSNEKIMKHKVTQSVINRMDSDGWYLDLKQDLWPMLSLQIKNILEENVDSDRNNWGLYTVSDVVTEYLHNDTLKSCTTDQIAYINYTVFCYVQSKMIDFVLDTLNGSMFANLKEYYESYMDLETDMLNLKDKVVDDPMAMWTSLLPHSTVAFCNLCKCKHYEGKHMFHQFEGQYATKLSSYYTTEENQDIAAIWINEASTNQTLRLKSSEVVSILFPEGFRYPCSNDDDRM